jgi:hypothetical protein
VSGFDIGGQSGEERGINIALAGLGAKMLLDYWVQAHMALAEVQKAARCDWEVMAAGFPKLTRGRKTW